ncbi:hypothetical protein HQ520_18705 [bacterium]|nr:hypothetical protein [bacterium]
MRRFLSRPALGVLLLAAMLMTGAAAGQDTPEDDYPGEILYGRFSPDPGQKTGAGVRVARVVRREELPGGPWATGDIGDYIIESTEARVIVRGDLRSPMQDGVPGPGQIVDVAFNDQMWDSFGGLTQMARVNGEIDEVVFSTIQVKEPANEHSQPFLACYGVLRGHQQVQVITVLYLVPNQPILAVESRFTNTGEEPLKIGIVDSSSWGALGVFLGGYGVPSYSHHLRMGVHWICGFRDDFVLGIVNQSRQPMAILDTNQNRSVLLHDEREIQPGQMGLANRHLILTRGDMAPISEFSLRTKQFDYGWLSGTIRQYTDKAPATGEEVDIYWIHPDKDAKYKLNPYGMTQTNEQGHYRFPLPVGEYFARSHSRGRPVVPPRQASFFIRKNQVTEQDYMQTEVNRFSFEAIDGTTSRSMPAKVRFESIEGEKIADLGPAWEAEGARDVVYLRPGPNEVPLPSGRFNCIFSRGPEYEIVQREIHFRFDKPQTIQVKLSRVVPTENMISVDLNAPTEASPESRVSAEDLVLAAAGEGLEWIVSGDLDRVTDLGEAIRAQGLEDWIRASAGVRLSYQFEKLFGDFYVFPVPVDTPACTLEGLAGPESSPGEFFAAVRTAFPGALITVLKPSEVNASYFGFYGTDVLNDKLPVGEPFSWDFDAIMAFEGKSESLSHYAWQMVELFLKSGHAKIPLASSFPGDVYYEEPGYPRIYVFTTTDDFTQVREEDMVQTLRDSGYFITNGPIVELKINGERTRSPLAPADNRFQYTTKVLAAPWVQVTGFVIRKSGRDINAFQVRPKERIQVFPTSEESARPDRWSLFIKDAKGNITEYYDAFLSITVTGQPLKPVVTFHGRETSSAFAITPPVIIDSQGDGKFDFR